MTHAFCAQSQELDRRILALEDWPSEAVVIALDDYAGQDWVDHSPVAVMILDAPDDREFLERLDRLAVGGVRFPIRQIVRHLDSKNDLATPAVPALALALARCRVVRGETKIPEPLLTAAGALELLSAKRRFESERVSPIVRSRHIRLADGGLADLYWLTSLLWLTRTWQDEGEWHASVPKQLKILTGQHRLNAVEADELLDAWSFLKQLEAAVVALDVESGLLPENPDKLEVIAERIGQSGANPLLAKFLHHREAVRSLLCEFVERGFA